MDRWIQNETGGCPVRYLFICDMHSAMKSCLCTHYRVKVKLSMWFEDRLLKGNKAYELQKRESYLNYSLSNAHAVFNNAIKLIIQDLYSKALKLKQWHPMWCQSSHCQSLKLRSQKTLRNDIMYINRKSLNKTDTDITTIISE